MLALCGCAKMQNEIAADGGFFTSHNGTYIVRNDSGGRIMDVWVMRDVIVQEGEHGAGFLFRDQNGNVIHLGGDCRVMRLRDDNDPLLSKYHDYHAEFEQRSYQEKWGQP